MVANLSKLKVRGYLCMMSFYTCHFHCSCPQLLCPQCPWQTDAPTGRESCEEKRKPLKTVLLRNAHPLPPVDDFFAIWQSCVKSDSEVCENGLWCWITCKRRRWTAESRRHSSTLTLLELSCSTYNTGRGALFSARLSFLVLWVSLPSAAESHSCSWSRHSRSLLRPSYHSCL